MNNLKEIRRAKGLTRNALEKVSGVPARAIKAYESGQVDLMSASYRNIIMLSNALDVEPYELFMTIQEGSI